METLGRVRRVFYFSQFTPEEIFLAQNNRLRNFRDLGKSIGQRDSDPTMAYLDALITFRGKLFNNETPTEAEKQVMDELMIQVAPNALAAINKMICPPDQLNDKDNLKALIEEINLIKKS